jgi:ABC-2 type transport system ATP-binding protein
MSSTAPDAQSPPRERVVEVQALTKTFKDFWLRTRAKAVDGLTFHIDRGEIFGLLGPNGSGKSTTIKILLGLLRQTSGRAAVFGKLPTDVAIKKRIGYLPEESYLYPFLNARETLDYYGKLFQLDRRTRQHRIDELLDMVGLAAVQNRAVREYSKGMQRRIGIAQALINDPEFLILDEPTTGLDPIGTRQIKDLILELGRRGKSILLSSHLLADVEDCVDRMVILYGGKMQREGTCEQLLTSSSGSVIETEELDEATISEIDQIIRRRSAGANAIRRVARPRQKLEDLFIQIVEEARTKRLETSGAQHGGQTAAFLRAEPAQGGALIDQFLAREEPVKIEPLAPAAQEQGGGGPDDSVISLLTKNQEPAEPAKASGSGAAPASTGGTPGGGAGGPAKAPAQDVDLGVIGSLLNDGGNAGGGSAGGPGKPGEQR